MDEQTELEPGSAAQTVRYQSGSSLEGYTGGFFPKAKDFNVSGGNFTSVSHIYQTAPSVPTDLRTIPLGDLDLLHKKEGGYEAVSRYRPGRASTKRVYTARLPGLQSQVTAAVYEGDGAEEDWQEEIIRYSNLRHPNLVQLYGVVKTRNLHAAVFHDDLIPGQDLKDKYYHSHVSAVYFWAKLRTAFSDVKSYMQPFLRRDLHWFEYTVWIRPSTGRPCIELAPQPELLSAWALDATRVDFKLSGKSLMEPPADSEILGSISLNDYHSICYTHLSQSQEFSILEHISVNPGSIRHVRSAQYEDSLEIAFVPDCRVYRGGWSTLEDPIFEDSWISDNNNEGTWLMEDGWIRVNSANVAEAYNCQIFFGVYEHLSIWLAQANHIFARLNITRDPENYVCINSVHYSLTFSASIDDAPPGYLFLCPLADLQDDFACFRIPVCCAYWSLDPSGAERFTEDEARTVGLPDIQLRTFHEAKGFDPYSQEVAIAMGHPLVEMSCELDDSLARTNGACDESSESDVEEYHDFPEAEEDRESTTGSCDADPPKFSGCDEAGMDDEWVFSCDEEPSITDGAFT
ncbi:hypothetical protein DFH06DRAFT_1385064 [Mycena polygramma]|nr:hypothetical protein DFH06DRAFT_1385064 [Mycena polygramma]